MIRIVIGMAVGECKSESVWGKSGRVRIVGKLPIIIPNACSTDV